MKDSIKVGMSGEERIVVDASNRIRFADDRMPAVLATPWLIQHLEFAARKALEPCLEEHERSVGVSVEIEHLAPTPEGFEVVCKARVVHVAGPVITFQVEAHDGVEVVSKGIHKRRVIDTERFRKRVSGKRQAKGLS